MKYFLTIVAALALASCGLSDEERAYKMRTELKFFKHQPSGLCFAWVHIEDSESHGGNVDGLTLVPCGKDKAYEIK